MKDKLLHNKTPGLRIGKIFVIALLFFGSMTLSFAQDKKVDINFLLQETQQLEQLPDEMTLIWWIPEDFWRINFEQNPNVTEAQTEEFLKVVRAYVVVAVINGDVGSIGGVTYKPESTIRNTIKLIDGQKNSYRPLSTEAVDADMQNFLLMMKPLIGNMLGPMGQNMHFFLFPPRNKEGQHIADPRKEGVFSVRLDKKEFRWRLPLGSLMEPKICPVDGEKLSGAWKFCPWHGVELK